MKRLLFIFCLAGLLTGSVEARQRAQGYCSQGGQKQIVSGITGAPLVQASYPGCTVTVFISGTSTIANIFADNIGTVKLNPFTADTTTGLWFWYADNGHYDVQLSGAGLPSTFTIGDILLTDFGSSAGTINVKPSLPNDPIQYVSLNGSDGNDGLSWASAKLTVFAAMKALPGGSASVAGGGTILLSGTVPANPIPTAGIWLMGINDPNYSSPPAGWLKWAGNALSIECVNKDTGGGNSHTPTCTVTGGNTTDKVHPLIWISSVAGPLQFKDFAINNYINNPVKIGIDSTNNRNGLTGGSSSITFDGVSWNFGGCRPGAGPGIDIGSNSFWIWMRKLTGSGCIAEVFTIAAAGVPGLNRTSNVVTVNTTVSNDITAGNNNFVTIQNATDPSFNGSYPVLAVNSSTQFTYSLVGPNATSGTGQVVTGASSAVNIDAGTGSGSGLVFIDEFNTNSGSIRLLNGTNGGGVYIRRGTWEGDFIDPAGPPVLIINPTTNVHVEDVESADAAVPVPAVQIDNSAGTQNFRAVVSRTDSVKGPAIVVGGSSSGTTSVSPLRQQTLGFSDNGRFTGGGIDASRRNFPPVSVTSVNLASTTVAAWTYRSGAGTITAGIAAPDGTTGAGSATSNAGQSFVNFYALTNTPLTVGDTYIYGAWLRSNTLGTLDTGPSFTLTGSGFGGGDTCSSFNNGAPTNQGQILFRQLTGDGQWIWMSGICKIYTNPTNAGITLDVAINNPHVVEIYSPTLIKIPAGTKSDNELFEIAASLAPFSPSCLQGQICGLDSQTLSMPGYVSRGVTFANLGTPANGNFIYCSDCTIANPCAGGGTGALAKRLNGVWVCN